MTSGDDLRHDLRRRGRCGTRNSKCCDDEKEENRRPHAPVPHTMKRLLILALPVLPVILAGCGKGKY
jgi:hypothetical protein